MVKPERSKEEVNQLLFGEENEARPPTSPTVPPSTSPPPATEPRLLNQKGLSVDLDTLEPVPFWKKPSVQIAFILTLGVPIGYGFISAFGGQGTKQTATVPNAEDREKEYLRQSVAGLRKDNTRLQLDEGLALQKMDVVAPKPKPAPQQPVYTPPPRVVQMPAPMPVRTYTPPPAVSIVRQEPRVEPVPVVRETAPVPVSPLAPKEPPPSFEEQMQKVAMLSKLGNYGSTGGDSIASNPTASSTPVAAVPNIERSDVSNARQAIGYAGSTAPFSPVAAAPNPGRSDLAPSRQAIAYSTPAPNNFQPVGYTETEPVPSNSSAQLVVGTVANAVIDQTVSWTAGGASGMRIPIRLTEPLIDSNKNEVIPAGSYLVAQVAADSAGDIQLLPTSVLLATKGRLQPEQQLPVPGMFVIQTQDGEILQAHTSGGTSRRGNRFISTFGSMAGYAPLPSGEYANGAYALGSLAQRSGQNYQYKPVTFSFKKGTRCRVYVNKSFYSNF